MEPSRQRRKQGEHVMQPDGIDDDIAQMTARIDDQVKQAQTHAAQMQQWSEEVDAITAEGSAMRGAVRLTVNNSGVVTSVRVSDQACDAGGAAVSRGLMEALQTAQQAVADAMGRSVAGRFGRDAEITQLMVGDLSTRLGVSVNLDEPRRGPRDGVIR
jgi:DNA-binding protein YbaB